LNAASTLQTSQFGKGGGMEVPMQRPGQPADYQVRIGTDCRRKNHLQLLSATMIYELVKENPRVHINYPDINNKL
jgi:hypothetical protein